MSSLKSKRKKLLPLKKRDQKPSKSTKNKPIKSSNNLDNNSLVYFPSRNNALIKENSHKSICWNWKTNDSWYESTDQPYEVAKDSAWKKPNTDSFDETLTK